ncbi:hypothetical protein B0H12DRAFT_1067213 [Mycena haematopus]|nr:hypothetical protein B0H12DRAFT_1067213 [Mycena haematopus]
MSPYKATSINTTDPATIPTITLLAPLLLPTEKARLQKALEQFQDINGRDGKIWTYDHGSSSWKEINRPKRTNGNSGKPIDIAASGLAKTWKYQSPIFCPHRRRSGLRWEPLVVKLSQPHDGTFIDYMKATDHECAFQTEIYGSDGEEDGDQPPQPSSSSSQPSSQSLMLSRSLSPFTTPHLPSSQTSASSSRDGGPSSSSMITFLASKALASPLPRYPGTYGTYRVIQATASPSILQASSSGRTPYIRHKPDGSSPSACNVGSSQRGPSNCLDRTNNYSDFAYTSIGRGVQDLSSTHGVTFDGYSALIRASVRCDGCSNSFSPDGYKGHRVKGICTNHPDLLTVSACRESEGPVRRRSYRLDEQGEEIYPEWRGHAQDTAIGAALREWNSRLGVPTDVWIMTSTATVLCARCDLVRTFTAHALHLDAQRSCENPTFDLEEIAYGARHATKVPVRTNTTTTLLVFPAMDTAQHWLSSVPLAPNGALFDGAAATTQRNSEDLVVFSPTLRLTARIAWPLVGNVQVPPELIAEYLLREKLHWACFCAINTSTLIVGDPEKLSCRIRSCAGRGEPTVAVCHYIQPKCQFFLNLTRIYHTCTLKEVYVPIQKTPMQFPPDSISQRYLSGKSTILDGDGFYLNGYLGEEGGVQINGKISIMDTKDFLLNYVTSKVSAGIQTESGPLNERENDVLIHLGAVVAVVTFWHILCLLIFRVAKNDV